VARRPRYPSCGTRVRAQQACSGHCGANRGLYDLARLRHDGQTRVHGWFFNGLLEALGQLTGGIAHDFNNILAAVLGYSGLALDRLVSDKSGKLAAYLREVIAASERGRDLIRKMLTFTRTQLSASASIVPLAAVVEEALAMLRPSIPAGILIRCEADETVQVRIDAGGLNQVSVNLVINARDAIDGQGEIIIRVRRVHLRGEICAISQQRLLGPFAALEDCDSGAGIRPEHLPRLFAPFFTNKDVGKGTGLGLSMVQGILRRAGGHVVVESQPGRGSCFRLLFQEAAAAAAGGMAAVGPTGQVYGGAGQRVWIVDDEATVAGYFGELLDGAGYRSRQILHPADALAALAEDANAVDLLITDLTMPGMSGLVLAERMRAARLDLPVLLCSGYSEDIDRDELLRHGISRVFVKPLQDKCCWRRSPRSLAPANPCNWPLV
jgi:CheY-like chemotaxis protein